MFGSFSCRSEGDGGGAVLITACRPPIDRLARYFNGFTELSGCIYITTSAQGSPFSAPI